MYLMGKKLNWNLANIRVNAEKLGKAYGEDAVRRKREMKLKPLSPEIEELLKLGFERANGHGPDYAFLLSIQRWALLRGPLTHQQKWRLVKIAVGRI